MDVHFNAYKVRYNTLDSIMKPVFQSQNIKTLNIFINVDDIIHKLHKPIIDNEFQVCGVNAPKQMIANFLNLIAHYRQWGIRQMANVRVYGIYTAAFGNFKNNIYVPSYRKHYIDITTSIQKFYYINDALKAAIPLMRVISQYIQDVYLIDSMYVEPSAIPYYISTEVFPADWNILITRDPYDLQYSYMDRWTYISPKGDNTLSINRGNFWDYIKEKEKVRIDTRNYDMSMYPLAISIIGDKYRNIPRLRSIGWKSLFKILEAIHDMSSDMSKTTSELLLLNNLTNKKISLDDINNNKQASDVICQVNNLGEIDKTYILDQIKDIPDYDTLMELNRTQFIRFPINIAFLTQEYKVYKQKSPFDR